MLHLSAKLRLQSLMRCSFWTRWESGSPAVQSGMIDFAQSKLLCNENLSIINDNAKIAVLARRLLLQFEPSREAAVETEATLVAGHMHVAYCVPTHREYLRSGASSEPILAEAAARIMASDAWKATDTATVLLQYLSSGLITRGEHGELVGRLLLIQAFDTAAKKLSDLKPVEFNHGIPVKDFLKALFSANFIDLVLDARPDNISGPSLGQAFDNAVVYFTHWGKAQDSNVINDQGAWMAMCRGMAYQCYNYQRDIDLVVPVLLDRTRKLGRFVMTAIMIQIKNHEKYQRENIHAEKLGFFTPGSQNPRPYITITMELGVKSNAASPQPPATRSRPAPEMPSEVTLNAIQGRTNPPRAKRPKLDTIIHPRYSFLATGCTETVYNVIRNNQRGTYQGLLASHGLLDECPRSDNGHIQAVVQLKPYWSMKENYSWAKSSEAKSREVKLEDTWTKDTNEGVKTGPFPDSSQEDN